MRKHKVIASIWLTVFGVLIGFAATAAANQNISACLISSVGAGVFASMFVDAVERMIKESSR